MEGPPPAPAPPSTAPSRRALSHRLPYPQSLCHECDAPPRYIRTERSVFILCPVLPSTKYPPQPVIVCPGFSPRAKGQWVPLEGPAAPSPPRDPTREPRAPEA